MSYYIIAPLESVKGPNSLPEFNEARRETASAARARASQLWTGFIDGGLLPSPRQYGVGPLRKNDMAGDTTDSVTSGSYSFRSNKTATGWQDIFNYTVRDDEIHAFDGFGFSEPTLRMTQIRFQFGERRFPIFDLQEAQLYERFAILLKTDQGKPLVVDPGTSILMRGFFETIGQQRVIPLGLNVFKRVDILLDET